ncbi:hypothetical protein XFF7767_240014 [Xanthomonas citri pv. fuscans]|nr:hypothetical protein XFF7767_240014 [Xanthomonas citri pv. fuscans]SOO16595.1 hypothetical protein XFF7766_850014 [Xanthomonas citri pv. fuscans]
MRELAGVGRVAASSVATELRLRRALYRGQRLVPPSPAPLQQRACEVVGIEYSPDPAVDQ